MYWTLLLLLGFAGLCSGASVVKEKKQRKLIVILVDGARWDYLQMEGLQGFRRLMDDGARAKYIVPDFPASSYPNYYSIMTGLHTESHGFVGNYMYDVVHETVFDIGRNPEQFDPYWWNDGDPLWITATRQGLQAAMFYWPGAEVTIKDLNPRTCIPYPGPPTLEEFAWAVNTSVEMLQNNTADIAGIYFEFVDKYGHQTGPLSALVNKTFREVDLEIDRLLDLLEDTGLRDNTDVMVVSDHGMLAVELNCTIDIDEPYRYLLDNHITKTLRGGPNIYIWPKENKTDELYKILKNIDEPKMTVYLRKDIPERWHYKHHYRTPPILLTVEPPCMIKFLPDKDKPEPANKTLGDHGYPPEYTDMRGIFLASGPDFRQGAVVPGFANVNIYQLMCHVLDISPSPNNGTWRYIEGMLSSAPQNKVTFYTILLAVASVTACLH